MHRRPSSGGGGQWGRGGPPPPVGGPPGGYGGTYAQNTPGATQPGMSDWDRAQAAHSNPRQPEANVENVIPACPSHFPQIQNMSIEELRQLGNDPSAFDEFIRQHPHRQVIERELTKVREQVAEMEARNTRRQAELSRLTGGGSGMTLEEQLSAERAKLAEAQARFDAWLSRNSRDALLKKLKDAVEESSSASKALTERFTSGDMTYEEYISEFRESRRQFHERSIKLERFQSLHQSGRPRS